MSIKDLISKKDYDYISMRATYPNPDSDENIFIGVCKSEGGKLIALDHDTYSDEEEVVSYEEWENEEEGVKNGLTIVVTGEWISGSNLDQYLEEMRKENEDN